MRLLADENVPGLAIQSLRSLGHDVLAILEIAPGSSDPQVLERATAEGRLLVTFDRDFGALVHHLGQAAKAGILFVRLVPTTPEEAAALISAALALPGASWAGMFSVLERNRLRQRPLPGREESTG
jgi:predicted nuclease of predicted toxin-antitoxin system